MFYLQLVKIFFLKNCKLLQTYNIDLKNCIGILSNRAPNVCGHHDSVLSRLKSKNSNVVFIKCTCHSLALCCEHANKTLLSQIDYLLSEITQWFKLSSLCQEDFKKVFALFNNDFTNYSKFITSSHTRWLIKGKCIYTILIQWKELKTYFNLI